MLAIAWSNQQPKKWVNKADPLWNLLNFGWAYDLLEYSLSNTKKATEIQR